MRRECDRWKGYSFPLDMNRTSSSSFSITFPCHLLLLLLPIFTCHCFSASSPFNLSFNTLLLLFISQTLFKHLEENSSITLYYLSHNKIVVSGGGKKKLKEREREEDHFLLQSTQESQIHTHFSRYFNLHERRDWVWDSENFERGREINSTQFITITTTPFIPPACIAI